ncbi:MULTISPECIES: hypothetical protein [Mycolicibacterium]|uniref:hypothetical protein n=1 Tax=Mycolicibacterium TaxID=1866885 RepID=UPI001F42B9AB|nr:MULTISPECIES: hypothetical protein [Mycolicibacterium]
MIQYDLFGEVEAAEKAAESAARSASMSAIVFLTQTPWPDLIGWWLHPDAIESRTDGGASYRSGPNNTPGWAWAKQRRGLLFESNTTWPGFDKRPRWCIPWTELRTLRAEHPDVTERLQALAAGRGHPCSLGWLWWTDPHALRPEGWHPSRLDSEQQADYYHGCARPETAYTDRLDAWHLVLDVVRSATLAVTKRQPT